MADRYYPLRRWRDRNCAIPAAEDVSQTRNGLALPSRLCLISRPFPTRCVEETMCTNVLQGVELHVSVLSARIIDVHGNVPFRGLIALLQRGERRTVG